MLSQIGIIRKIIRINQNGAVVAHVLPDRSPASDISQEAAPTDIRRRREDDQQQL
jgi:hypothetical protein